MVNRTLLLRCIILTVLVVSGLVLSNGCTYVEVRYGETPQEYLIGRTMELGGVSLEKGWKMTAFRRGARFPYSLVPVKVVEPIISPSRRQLRGEKTHFSTSIGFLASTGSLELFGFEMQAVVDGMNEAGLSMSAHTHVRAQYAEGTQAERVASVHIDYLVLIPWVLGKFNSTVAATQALTSGDVAVLGHSLLPKQLSIHFALADASGHSVVLEWVKGTLQVHENTVGVMTNDPEFDWHLLNLNQYSYMSPQTSDWSQTVGTINTEQGPVPSPGNHGLNLVGLPGDAGPQARFVRTFILRELAMYNEPVATRKDAIQLTTALLNNVVIPNGVVSKISLLDTGDFTQWALIKDPQNLRTLFRSYADNSWKQIDLNLLMDYLTSSAGETQRQLHVFTNDDGIQDVTAHLSA